MAGMTKTWTHPQNLSSVVVESAKNTMKRGHHERTLSVGYPSSETPRVDVIGGERDVASFDAAGRDF